eukprot:4351005-Amphidinium_carterae.1
MSDSGLSSSTQPRPGARVLGTAAGAGCPSLQYGATDLCRFVSKTAAGVATASTLCALPDTSRRTFRRPPTQSSFTDGDKTQREVAKRQVGEQIYSCSPPSTTGGPATSGAAAGSPGGERHLQHSPAQTFCFCAKGLKAHSCQIFPLPVRRLGALLPPAPQPAAFICLPRCSCRWSHNHQRFGSRETVKQWRRLVTAADTSGRP